MNKNLMLSAAVTLCVSCPLHAAHPAEGYGFWDTERWQVRGRVIGVIPDEESRVTGVAGEATVGNATVPEIDVTHFITPKIGIEAIAAVAQHRVQLNDVTDLGETVILPPTILAQYHFSRDQSFSPYVGAGINYSTFFNTDTAPGQNNLEMSGGFGTAVQAGFDYWLSDHWGVNMDVKKLWLNVDASLSNGAVKADVDLDPWIVGVGASYRF